MIAEDSDSDASDEDRGERKKKKKRRKRRISDRLDEDDIDLIEENIGIKGMEIIEIMSYRLKIIQCTRKSSLV